LRGKIFAREPSEKPAARAVERGAEQKNCLYIFLILRAPVFLLLKKKGNFSARFQ
jgi:hypothetical protein